MYEIIKTHDDDGNRLRRPHVVETHATLLECELAHDRVRERWATQNERSSAYAPFRIRPGPLAPPRRGHP